MALDETFDADVAADHANLCFDTVSEDAKSSFKGTERISSPYCIVPGLVACGDTDDALFGVASDDGEIAMKHIEKLVNKKSRLHKSFQSVILLHFF